MIEFNGESVPIEIYVKNLSDGKLEANPDSHDLNCSRSVVENSNKGSAPHKCTDLCIVYKEVMQSVADPDRVYSILETYERRHSSKC